MMHVYLPLFASFGCAVCNGLAAILQKISVEKEKKANSLDAKLIGRLLGDRLYIIGISLDIFGWLLTLYAVHYLPLYLVEAIIAANIAITALVEMFLHRTQLYLKSYVALVLIVLGLALVSLTASPEKVGHISSTLKYLIVLSPLPIIAIGAVFVRTNKYIPSIGLAVLAGLAFGDTSIIGRIFNLSDPLWHTVYSPLMIALIISGALGILLFSIALQRVSATAANATMTGAQILVPATLGVIFLGDKAHKGLGHLAVIGILLTIVGIILLGLRELSKT